MEPETLNQLSRRLKLPVAWIRKEVDAGRLPCLKAGRRLLFSPRAVNRVLLQRASTTTEAAPCQ